MNSEKVEISTDVDESHDLDEMDSLTNLEDMESIDSMMDEIDNTLSDFSETDTQEHVDNLPRNLSSGNLADDLTGDIEIPDMVNAVKESNDDQTSDIDPLLFNSIAASEDVTGEIEALNQQGPSESSAVSTIDEKKPVALDEEILGVDEDLDVDINIDLDINLDDIDLMDENIEESATDFKMPDFKNCADLSQEIEKLETFSEEHLNFCFENLKPELFDDNGEYVRVKRKITSLLKKLEEDKQEAARIEAEKIAREHEIANNIVSIDTLIQSATSTDLQTPNNLPKKEKKSTTNLFNDSFAKIKKFAKFPKLKISKSNDEDQSEKVVEKIKSQKLDTDLATTKELVVGHFNRALSSGPFAAGFLLIFEIIKTTVPAIIVGLFVLQVNKNAISPEILESLVSDDPSRIQIGLELVKSNISSESDKQKYYQLALKKIENQIDAAWNPHGSEDIIKRATFSLNLDILNFNDDGFNLNKLIQDKVSSNRKMIRSSYEEFYETELGQFESNTGFIGNIREANIFMSNKKCINALEKFIEAQRFNLSSKSAKYGQTIAVNCLSTEGNRAILTQKIFELQGRLDGNIYLNESQKRQPAGTK